MRAVFAFVAPRLLRALVAVWLVSSVVFVVMRLSGDPVPLLLPPDAPHSEILRVRAELGLDRPVPVQYAVFFVNVLRGDFGRSIHFREPAARVVLAYLPATLELGLTAFVLAALVALPIGLISAMKRNSWLDHAVMAGALVGQAAPTFFLGILFILVISLKAGLLPTSGRGDWRHLVLPAVTLGAFSMALGHPPRRPHSRHLHRGEQPGAGQEASPAPGADRGPGVRGVRGRPAPAQEAGETGHRPSAGPAGDVPPGRRVGPLRGGGPRG